MTCSGTSARCSVCMSPDHPLLRLEHVLERHRLHHRSALMLDEERAHGSQNHGLWTGDGRNRKITKRG